MVYNQLHFRKQIKTSRNSLFTDGELMPDPQQLVSHVNNHFATVADNLLRNSKPLQ